MQGHLYIIDVSQAVDLDHPHALDFLREDCLHVSVSHFTIMAFTLLSSSCVVESFCVKEDYLWFSLHFFIQDFFRKHGVAVMTIRELFDFIVDPAIDDDSVDSYLEEV